MNTHALSFKLTLAAATVAVLGLGAYLAGKTPGHFGDAQSTDDAFVTADYTVVAPKVGGFIAEVLVADNQFVQAGQLLARIDDRDYQVALSAARAGLMSARGGLEQAAASLEQQQALIAQATAMVKVADAEISFAERDLGRYTALAGEGAGSVQNAEQARSKIDTAQAKLSFNQAVLAAAKGQVKVLGALRDKAEGEYTRAGAELKKAELNLGYASITAPIDGVIGQRTLRVGNLVAPGTALMAVVPVSRAYVVGNFRETQLTHVQPRQRVDISVDAFPGTVLHGSVNSIAPATGVEFSPIKPSNATGNFTKVVQRIAVKIDFDAGQDLTARLRSGMSVIATIKNN